jgi:hypothetical protein
VKFSNSRFHSSARIKGNGFCTDDGEMPPERYCQVYGHIIESKSATWNGAGEMASGFLLEWEGVRGTFYQA